MSEINKTKKKGGRPSLKKSQNSSNVYEDVGGNYTDDGSSEIDIPEINHADEVSEKRAISHVLEEEIHKNDDIDFEESDDKFDFHNDIDIDSFNEIPTDNWTPLEEEVIERSYTHGFQPKIETSQNVGSATNIIPEANFNAPANSFNDMEFESDFIKQQMMGGNDIPMDDSGSKSKQSSYKKSYSSENDDIPTSSSERKSSSQKSSGSPSSSGNSSKSESNNTPPPNNLEDLNPAQKKKAVKGTADAILQAYRNFVPKGLTYLSTYDTKKLKKLHSKGEIDIDAPVNRDGTTFFEYVSIFNDNVEEAFRFSNDEIEQLREPLEDVLMENNVAFTAMQRLVFVMAQQLVGKFMLVIKFVSEKRNTINEMKAMHSEKLELMRQQGVVQINNNNNSFNQSKVSDDIPKRESENITVTNDIPKQESNQENDIPSVTLESIMNDDTELVENDIPNTNDEIMVVEAEELPPSDY